MTDPETTALKGEFINHSSGGGGMPRHAGPNGEDPGSVGGQKKLGENMGQRLCCGFPEKEQPRQARQAKRASAGSGL